MDLQALVATGEYIFTSLFSLLSEGEFLIACRGILFKCVFLKLSSSSSSSF
jgi:hypothetical protein